MARDTAAHPPDGNATRSKGPVLLARTGNRVVRPKDFEGEYSNVWAEFGRLTRTRALTRVAHGYYVLVPEERRGGFWQPEIEGLALGIAVADYGLDSVALMGPAAARVLGAIPRALAGATVAVPRQRPAIATYVGTVHFVKRAASRLDTQRVTTEITAGWATTPEQTALDLADRPGLGEITPSTAAEAIRVLGARVHHQDVAMLAADQHKVAAWQRYCWVLGLPAAPARRDVPTRGLLGVGDPATYGLVPSER
jgi:hypothetical protein